MMSDRLMHYASKYYDPAKAHEYYMRTRELKGRRSTSSLSDEGKEVWGYAKQQITSEKKSRIDSEKEEQTKKLEELRQKASESRERITEKLKKLNDALTDSAAAKRKRINSQYSVPKGASKRTRARIAAQKSKKLAELSAETKSEKSENSEDASSRRKRVAQDLKTAISAAREAYKQAKVSIDASYEEIFQQEFDKIASEYAKQSKKSKKSGAVQNTVKTAKKPDLRELISKGYTIGQAVEEQNKFKSKS